MKAKYEVAEAWNDFWTFVEAVGERPSPNHRLMRLNEELGYGPDNFYWKETIECKDAAEYARKWRKANPDSVRNSDLKTKYGITLEDYNSMLDKQNGVCAMCETTCSSGLSLAVDHCHTTKKIRGLLCSNCNNLLGRAKDSTGILHKAIEYLNKTK